LSQRVSASTDAIEPTPGGETHVGQRLGSFLCWAVVFADIGTSIYYVPGILYGEVNRLAGLFVLMTMIVFLLLVLKYAEVSVRFPEGGGVVTVSARALHPWAGAVGGMFILVDYFLTAAISSLSGLQYFSAFVPRLGPFVLIAALGVLAFLGVLNWWGIKESATVSAVIAVVALMSDLLIILVVLLTYSPSEILLVLGKMFSGTRLTGLTILTGFAGAFLAFSGLESISQLSPVMKVPRSKTVTRALGLVVLTIGITSPLLTIFSTVLLTTPLNAAHGIPAPFDTIPLNRDQLISELARAYGGRVLEVTTAVSASALLIFASNTAIIGTYHVFLALSRMRFFPEILQRMSQRRGTPHVAIFLAAGIPMLILIAVQGSIEVLGNLYAFGLLGAFILTCVSLDVIRWRERHADVLIGAHEDPELELREKRSAAVLAPAEPTEHPWDGAKTRVRSRLHADQAERLRRFEKSVAQRRANIARHMAPVWLDIRYYLGFVTTLLVALAWVTNLFSKPDATLFGGGLTLLGVGVAVVNFRHQQRAGAIPVFPMARLRPMPHAILVALPASGAHNMAVVRACVEDANRRPLVFTYLAEREMEASRAFQFADPYLYDREAQRIFSRAANLCQQAGVSAHFLYLVGGAASIIDVWRAIRPDEIVTEAPALKSLSQVVSSAYVRYRSVDGIQVAYHVSQHLSAPPNSAARVSETTSGLHPYGRPRTMPEDRPHAPAATDIRHEDSSPGATNGAKGQETNLEEWIWTGTNLVPNQRFTDDDERPTHE
jgi:amino acid transporter